MLANTIDPAKFGSDFPESSKISAGDSINVAKFEKFLTPTDIKGVSLTDNEGKVYHTTAKQPVGYILSENVGIQALLDNPKNTDKAVTLFFYEAKPDQGTRNLMLKCSVYPQKGA